MNLKETNRIKIIREHFNLTVEELSSVLDIPQRTIGSYERGENPPNGKFIKALVEKLKINANWFLTGNGGMIFQNENNISKLTEEQFELISEIVSDETGYNLLVKIANIKRAKNEAVNDAILALKNINSRL